MNHLEKTKELLGQLKSLFPKTRITITLANLDCVAFPEMFSNLETKQEIKGESVLETRSGFAIYESETGNYVWVKQEEKEIGKVKIELNQN